MTSMDRGGRGIAVFAKRMAEVLGVSPDEVHDVFRGARPTTVRFNTLNEEMGSGDALAYIQTRGGTMAPVDWCENAFFCPEGEQVAAAIELANRGIVFLQNASSLLPVVVLDPRPGDRILDVAAAPGGKAFHVAARMQNDGELWLNDAIKPRAEKLSELAALYNVKYAHVTTHQAQYLDKYLDHEFFDRILLDVQCTGEGRVDLRRSDALKHWSEDRLREYSFAQTKMLSAAYKLLKPGGTMVYSTCSLSPEENEIPVTRILSRHLDLDVANAMVAVPTISRGLVAWRRERLDRRLSGAIRVCPTRDYEGFFIAALVKAGRSEQDLS